ncbi:cell division cycle-associated 7-like protein [Herrania umbratica]|uniref:Cell division cycle-associated 7-like protein n=1 Tax=Herrania umbratica TaxID=108875 RepID=A0A6J1AZ86_9ROSI|nr:cell division cycle-associated 7-like protein [Herrania umbratica]XP_021292201.1 cell division cycle-associated 7-like protein [Herrania umbratica]
MGRLRVKSDYETLRNARIVENQARLASLGLHKTISELRSIVSSAKSEKTQLRKWQKKDYEITPLRRSNRLKRIPASSTRASNFLRRSSRLRGRDIGEENGSNSSLGEGEEKRPANAPLVKIYGARHQLSPEDSARRCRRKEGRGSVYNSVFGICCHFCRQKTLCAEEDCKRCGNLDVNQPCIGKTDCSVCHSSNGVLCRACLKLRYGEELEEVRENKEWMCPHCIEEKGINPYWICNSSICLKNRKIAPTGIAIYRALELGYKSVAHLLMDELLRKDPSRLRCSQSLTA